MLEYAYVCMASQGGVLFDKTQNDIQLHGGLEACWQTFFLAFVALRCKIFIERSSPPCCPSHI